MSYFWVDFFCVLLTLVSRVVITVLPVPVVQHRRGRRRRRRGRRGLVEVAALLLMRRSTASTSATVRGPGVRGGHGHCWAAVPDEAGSSSCVSVLLLVLLLGQVAHRTVLFVAPLPLVMALARAGRRELTLPSLLAELVRGQGLLARAVRASSCGKAPTTLLNK